jgi:hypothetical protein
MFVFVQGLVSHRLVKSNRVEIKLPGGRPKPRIFIQPKTYKKLEDIKR